jgi:hypothetical protein
VNHLADSGDAGIPQLAKTFLVDTQRSCRSLFRSRLKPKTLTFSNPSERLYLPGLAFLPGGVRLAPWLWSSECEFIPAL